MYSLNFKAILCFLALFCLMLFSAAISDTIEVPAQQPTIQDGINSANNSDTVLVAPGIYTESLDFMGKAIVVKSSSGPLETVITENPSVNLVVFTNGETSDAVLEGFTLDGGRIGILCENAGPTIKYNILRNQNIIDWGAISLGGDDYGTSGASPAVIINNTIVNCANGGISTFSTEAPVIKNNIIAFNTHYAIHRNSTGLPHPIMFYNDVYGNAVDFQNISDLGDGALAADPIFVFNFALGAGSPCIDAGHPDAAFNDPDDSRNDIGAVPYTGGGEPREPMTLYVPSEYELIQTAFSFAISGDTIMVAAGTYSEYINFYGKSIIMLSESGADETIIIAPSEEYINSLPNNYDSTATDAVGMAYRTAMTGSYSNQVINAANCNRSTIINGFTIDGNYSVRGVYGMNSSAEISDCIIQNCVGSYDAGGVFFQDGAPLIKDNLFRYNETPISGGAVFIRLGYGFGTAEIIGNIMYNNISGNGPAVTLIEGDDALVERNVCFGNIGTPGSTRKGAIYFRGDNIGVINNTLVSNTLGITVLMTSNCDVRNNIVVTNEEYGIEVLYNEGPNPELTYDYNDVWGNGGGDYWQITAADHDISADPIFSINYGIATSSPCIDTGDPDAIYNDPDGSRNDIGAIPYSGEDPRIPMTLYVPSEYSTIQEALNFAISGDTVMVAAGTYTEEINFFSKSVVLLSESGADETIIISSSDNFTSSLPNDYDSASIDAGDVAYKIAGALSFANQIINIANTNESTVINGFTIDGNSAVRGVYGMRSSAEISDCIIQNCVGPYDAGGVFFENGAPLIKNNLFRYNETPISGGAVFVRLGYGYGTARIIGNIMHDNISGNGPAVSLIQGDDAVVERNVCYNNIGTPGSVRKGAIYFNAQNVKVVNNTCVGNTLGITVLLTADCDVRNNIVVNNEEYGIEVRNHEGPNPGLTYDYNDVWGNGGGDYWQVAAAAHDISADPVFTADYGLEYSSPCINAGDPNPIYNDPDGSPNDIGAIPMAGGGPIGPSTLYIPETNVYYLDGLTCDTGIIVPLRYNCGIATTAMNIPLTWDDPNLELTAVEFNGTAVENWSNAALIDNENQTVLMGLIGFAEPEGYFIDEGIDTEIARMRFHYNCDLEVIEDSIFIRFSTAFIGDIDNELLFVDTALVPNDFVPYVNFGPLLINTVRPGDASGDGKVNILDIVYLINHKYKGGQEPTPPAVGDVNVDCDLNILDIAYLINYKYKSGPTPEYGCYSGSSTFGQYSDYNYVGNAELTASIQDGTTFIKFSSAIDQAALEISMRTINGSVHQINSKTDGLEAFFSNNGNEIRLALLDITGSSVIPSGENTILEIDGEVEILTALGADLNAAPIKVEIIKDISIPSRFQLSQNYPNPFNPNTSIKFSIPKPSDVRIDIFNIAGQQIATILDRKFEAGHYTASWDGCDANGSRVSSGIYLYQLKADGFTASRKMLLIK